MSKLTAIAGGRKRTAKTLYSVEVREGGEVKRRLTPAGQVLVEEHRHLVQRHARRAAKSLPAWVEMDELEALGLLGLVDAATRFDGRVQPVKNFGAWAALRIYGSIMDAFRGRNYPRLAAELPEEWLGIEDVDTTLRGTSNSRHRRTNVPERFIDRIHPEAILIEHQHRLIVSIMAAKAGEAALTDIEAQVLAQRMAGMSMRDIGRAHKREQTWAHQVIHAALDKMREALEADFDVPELTGRLRRVG